MTDDYADLEEWQNLNTIGIEIEPRYFDIACQRIEKAYEERSAPLYGDYPPQARQLEITSDMEVAECELAPQS